MIYDSQHAGRPAPRVPCLGRPEGRPRTLRNRRPTDRGGPLYFPRRPCVGALPIAHWARNGRSPLHFAARLAILVLQPWVQAWSGVEIAPQAIIGPGLYLGHFGPIIVGDTVLGSTSTCRRE